MPCRLPILLRASILAGSRLSVLLRACILVGCGLPILLDSGIRVGRWLRELLRVGVCLHVEAGILARRDWHCSLDVDRLLIGLRAHGNVLSRIRETVRGLGRALAALGGDWLLLHRGSRDWRTAILAELY